MRLHRGLWAGAFALLALVGCGKDNKTIKDTGVYSPILTGIASNHEPAARGTENLLTAQVTNVNDVPLRYHWSAAAGTLTDSTSATAKWTPPDSIGAYNVTVSIEADDGGKHFFRTMTVLMSVDNEYTRWTGTEAVKFDPAPTAGGSVLFAQYRDPIVKSSDAYRVDTPLGPAILLTTDFFSVGAPSANASQTDFAFTGRKNQTDSISIYLLPFAGGDTSMTRLFAARRPSQTFLASPRYAPVGTRLAYTSDSTEFGAGANTQVYLRDGSDLNVGPVAALDPTVAGSTYLLNPSWGPDKNGDGTPDSIMMTAVDFPGTFFETRHGMYIVALTPPNAAQNYSQWLDGQFLETPDWSPDGQYVTFVKRNAGTNDRDIWIINRSAADISQAVRVTSGPADDSQPRFSADGNSIFFISNRVDRYGVTGVYGTERRGTNIWSVAHFDRP